ncbi:hypothetical protein CDL12_15719 [Handroanthus impetiginosus]|uniref:Uncharacterized protein n=1 Tax=Handroanthus impetiginosus TaxID=429701 RepID=A0A2G9H2B8_9LAMI|nr:hypothetical protein CDL12_15719 [Handroanthus impetiginosus]
MAEGFEPYHVPQQSRRDKLRVNNQGCVENLHSCAPLVPLYDPSLISSDLINSGANVRQSFNLGSNTSVGVKEEGVNLMGFAGGVNTNHIFVDPQLSVQLNPSTIQDINGNPYVYYRGVLDEPFGNEVVYKPESNSGQSLSLSLSSHHSNLPLELNLQRYDFSNNNKGSRFLKPAQQLLEELCDVGRGIYL